MWLVDLIIVCPQWKIGVARRFIYCVPLMEEIYLGVARFIYCVPIMEDRSGTYIYLLRAPNGR